MTTRMRISRIIRLTKKTVCAGRLRSGRGQIIVVEGINGAGKTTLVEALVQRDGVIGARYVDSRRTVQRLLTNHPTSAGMFAAVVLFRRGALECLLQQGYVIIQDRGFLSEATHVPNAYRPVNRLLETLFGWIYPDPDWLVLLDVPPVTAYKRIQARDDTTERARLTIDVLEARRMLYLERFKRYQGNKLFLNGTLSVAESAKAIRRTIG